MSRFTRFCASSAVVGAITLALIKAIDLGLDAALPYLPTLFPLNSQLRFQTLDYDAVANINAFGFRGAQTEFRPGQIIAVGDSFTFGLGSVDEETWPHLLERRLLESGDGRSVYNLGTPGTDTLFHIKLARESLVMKPSIVVLSILLADDLQQVFESLERDALAADSTLARSARQTSKRVVVASLPGLYKLFRRVKYGGAPDRRRAAPEPQRISEGLSDEQLAAVQERISGYPPLLRQGVLDGKINLGLIQFADVYPDRSWRFWNDLTAGDPKALSNAQQIEREIAALAQEMGEYDGQLIVFAMPSGEFVSSRFTTSYRIYGASIPDENLSTLVPEDRLREIAERAGAKFEGALTSFRSMTSSDPFFPTDGHLNSIGNSLVAAILFASIEKTSRDPKAHR